MCGQKDKKKTFVTVKRYHNDEIIHSVSTGRDLFIVLDVCRALGQYKITIVGEDDYSRSYDLTDASEIGYVLCEWYGPKGIFARS